MNSSEMTNKCDMAIIDRSFSSFDEMAKWTFGGKLASTVFKYVTCGW